MSKLCVVLQVNFQFELRTSIFSSEYNANDSKKNDSENSMFYTKGVFGTNGQEHKDQYELKNITHNLKSA